MSAKGYKWKSIITQNDKVKHEMARKATERQVKQIVSIDTEADAEYKLHFQNLDQKREIRFLTKTVEELQGQLAATKKRLNQVNDKLLGKVKNKEVITDDEGVEYIIVTKQYDDEQHTKHAELLAQLESLRGGNRILEETVASQRERIEDIKKCIGERNKSILTHIKESDVLRDKINETKNHIDELEEKALKERESQENEKANLVSIIRERDNNLEIEKQNYESLAIELKEKQGDIENKLKQIGEVELRVAKKNEELDERKKEIEATKEELIRLNETLSEEKKEKEEYKTWIVQLKLREEKMIEEKEQVIKDNHDELRRREESIKKLKETNKKLSIELKKAPKPNWK